MRRTTKNWEDDVDSILAADKFQAIHDDVLNTMYIFADFFEDEMLPLHAKFVLEKFIEPMERRNYHRVLVNVGDFNRRFNNFDTYTLIFTDAVRLLARYRMGLEKTKGGCGSRKKRPVWSR